MRELCGRDVMGRRHPAPRTPEWQPAGLCERQAGMRRGEIWRKRYGMDGRGREDRRREGGMVSGRGLAAGRRDKHLSPPAPPACRELHEDTREL